MTGSTDFIAEFEEKFLKNIPEKFYGKKIILAVSGGADSMALLNSCLNVREKTSWQIRAVTVNHRIRTEEQSRGDCEFVRNYCDSRGIECVVVEAEENEIALLEKQRNRGIEEAARFFRYSALSEQAEIFGADCVFLAHNKNDQLETILQRFLQGSFGRARLGIPRERDLFFRPLLDFSRTEIERYLNSHSVPYRTDCTNFDEIYLRNKIRNKLIPYLDENFEHWASGILHGEEKYKIEEDFLDGEASRYVSYFEHSGHLCFCMDSSVFNSLHLALKIRLVYKVLDRLELNARISYENILKFCDGSDVQTCGVEMYHKSSKVFVKQHKKSGKSSLLFAIIDKIGDFEFESGLLMVRNRLEDLQEGKRKHAVCISLPFEFRMEISDKREIKTFELTDSGKKVYFYYEKFR